MRLPSESTTLATPLTSPHAPHAIGTQRDTGLAEVSVVQYVCALIRHHTTEAVNVEPYK
uniref:Histidine kinase n=1 Tax=Mesocestoides corti TaxID=53468 RepID=A0A5K3G4D5_MESCO